MGIYDKNIFFLELMLFNYLMFFFGFYRCSFDIVSLGIIYVYIMEWMN